MKNQKKRTLSPRTVIGIFAIIALAFTVIACKDDDDGSGSIPSAPKGVMYSESSTYSDSYFNGTSYISSSVTNYIISWPGVPGALQYFVYDNGSRIGVVTEAAYGNQAYSYSYTNTDTLSGSTRFRPNFYVSAVNSHGESKLSKAAVYVYEGMSEYGEYGGSPSSDAPKPGAPVQ